MKFKFLVIAFSIIIIIIILLTAFLPVLMAGAEFAESLRFITIPLMIFMALLLVFMVVFFLLNYRLFSLLEKEDWPALSYYLENRIFVNGRYSAGKVRLLASSYMVVSDYASVLKLENKAMQAKPSTVDKNVLIFGSARVLGGNYREAAEFFRMHMEKAKAKEKQWVCWFYGFSLLLNSSFRQAEVEFVSLAVSSENALITGLSAYFIASSLAKYAAKPEECCAIAENGRRRLIKAFKNINGWKNEADKTGTDIHIAIIRKYVDEAGEWLFRR